MSKLNGHPASAVHMLEPHSLDRSAFGPEALTVIRQAFDEAWETIAGNFGDDASRIDAARTRLANALLSVAKNHTRDVEALKRDAMQIVARDIADL
jgi:hypothetical protein